MKIVIVAGGTGGHFYPGLSVAHRLVEKGEEVRFVVRKNDYVIPFLEREKIPFDSISASGLSRSMHPKNILSLFQILKGFCQSYFILRSIGPDVLLVMGGYLSFPPAVAARLLGIPIVLHEQNVKPGLANRWLGRLARKVALSFEESKSHFGSQAQLTGNPIRKSLNELPGKEEICREMGLENNVPILLIFGGSQGAHGLNALCLDALTRLDPDVNRVQVVHLTGKLDESWIKEQTKGLKCRILVSAYCHTMEKLYAISDLILCRAGASTISELMAIKKPAILVPYPYATDQHQKANADVLGKKGAVLVFEERELSGERLKTIFVDLLENPGKLADMKSAYQKIDQPNSEPTEHIIRLLKDVF
ncbi:undecaprenyldiphospho-muramoylpentapeptide beta-N-acetylglucosaminyltransferase [bacterium F11]|nr:undecaprenyldiphospho-muramoylpentapeptide beta-N-acetylglucosaminyltransferase [bacterium F11]